MIHLRRLITLTNGKARPEDWTEAAKQEAPVRGKPVGCAVCPLRIGGEWDDGASAAVSQMNDGQAATMKRRGCHAEDRPCAGMRRLLKRRGGSAEAPPG